MTIYFGFIPSNELNNKIEDTIDLVHNRTDENFYIYQKDITNQITHELLDELFTYLIDIILDTKRQEKMRKLVTTIHSSVDSMLKHVISKQPNDKVIESFQFLHKDCLFLDNESNLRVGFVLSEEDGQKIIKNLQESHNTEKPHELLQEAMDLIIKANLDHFIVKFSQTLNLGVIKRKAVPIAEIAIKKASRVAIHKLLPEMQTDACLRLADHFDKFIVEKQ